MNLDIEFNGILLPIELAQICSPAAAVIYAVLNDVAENGITHLSNNEIGKRAGVPSRSVPAIISKLEALGIVERHYNPGYATSYYVKDILQETKWAEQPKRQTPAEVPAKQAEPVHKKVFGEYKHVHLTQSEYEKLVSEFGEKKTTEYIKRCDEQQEKTGKFYSNCYVPIKNWITEDKNKSGSNAQYRPGKGDKYNFKGKTYRDLIEEATPEMQEHYRKVIYDRQLDMIAKMPLSDLEEMNKYEALAESLVNRFS